MISYLAGKIYIIEKNELTLLVNGIGITLLTPSAQNYTINQDVLLFTYLNWNSENGPSLFGFSNKFEKTLFMLLIGCPKIGPKAAINILSQMPVSHIITAICEQNIRTLSNLSGVGIKTAEQIILQLKEKITKLLASGELTIETTENNNFDRHGISTAFTSLGYTKQEVSKALSYLTSIQSEKKYSFDQLLKSGLQYLSQKN